MNTETLTYAYAYALGLGTNLNNLKYTVLYSKQIPDLENINKINKTNFTVMVCKQITNPLIIAQIQKLYY